MTDRENSPAYAAPPRSARRVFAAIERAIGDGSSASVSYVAFSLEHHIGRQSISPALKLLGHLGLIEIEPGPRLVNIFRFSNRWRTVDEVEAVRLAALAREVKLCRTFEKRLEPKPVTKPMPSNRTGERPRIMRRRVPSLPTMPWQDDGRWRSGRPPQAVAACLSRATGRILSSMGTKSGETIYGVSVRAAAERATEARKDADRLTSVSR